MESDCFDYKLTEDNIYLYPETQVLKNKLGITDYIGLKDVERMITGLRMSEIIEKPIKGDFDLEHLKAIHRYIFQDLYEWAGELRVVNLIKGNSQFCNMEYIETNANNLFSQLKSENYLFGLSKDKLIERLVYFLSELNAIHPFREGNGRVQRIFINYLANLLGYDLDFELAEPIDVLIASIASFNGYNSNYIKLFNRIILRYN